MYSPKMEVLQLLLHKHKDFPQRVCTASEHTKTSTSCGWHPK